MDALDGQEFHELCMDYRAALVWGPKTPQECFVELQAFIRREVRREALEEAVRICREVFDNYQDPGVAMDRIRALIEPSSPPER